VKIFGFVIERDNLRRKQEDWNHYQRLFYASQPTRDLVKEIKELRRAFTREAQKTREAMLCPSVYFVDDDPSKAVRCRHPRGHGAEHYASGYDWETVDEKGEITK
jgi:hypothetical protein